MALRPLRALDSGVSTRYQNATACYRNTCGIAYNIKDIYMRPARQRTFCREDMTSMGEWERPEPPRPEYEKSVFDRIIYEK